MSKEISWLQVVTTNDPDVDKEQVVYEFSNGRTFLEKRDPYN